MSKENPAFDTPFLRPLTDADKQPLPDEILPDGEPYMIAGIPSESLGFLLLESPTDETDTPITKKEFAERKELAEFACWQYRIDAELQHGGSHFDDPEAVSILEGLATDIIFGITSEERERTKKAYMEANNQ